MTYDVKAKDRGGIFCPGCGQEMQLNFYDDDYGVIYGCSYFCHRCGWNSPMKHTQQEAWQAAVLRHPQKEAGNR